MTPNGMQAAAQRILAIYDQAELRLLEVMKDAASDKYTTMWYKKKNLELLMGKNMFGNILSKTTALGSEIAQELIANAYKSGAQAFLDEVRALGIDVPDTIEVTKLDRLLALQKEIDGMVQTVGHAILRDANDKYRQIVGDALQVGQLHVENHEQLMQRTLNRFADEGIFGFVDKAGRKWGMGEYTEMATRTGMMHAALEGYAQQAKQYGFDLIIVTDHADECPLCRPWENRILSLTGAEASNPECNGTLQQATAAGLFHPNCLHSYNAYVPGLSSKTGGDTQTPARNAEGYAARQTQRYYERQLRRWRRRESVAMDDKTTLKAESRITELEDAIDAIVQKYNTKRRRQREYPYVAIVREGVRITL